MANIVTQETQVAKFTERENENDFVRDIVLIHGDFEWEKLKNHEFFHAGLQCQSGW